MKYIIFVFLFAFTGCKSQDTLWHVVNGSRVPFSQAEATQIRAGWATFDSIHRLDSISQFNYRTSLANVIILYKALDVIPDSLMTTKQVRRQFILKVVMDSLSAKINPFIK